MQNLTRAIRPSYTLQCLQRWLNLVLELIVATIAVGVVAIAILLRGSTTGGEIGVALNLIIVTNTTLVKLVEAFTTLEVSLGTIARLKTLEAQTPQEDQPREKQVPKGNWPSKGEIHIENLTAGYRCVT